MKNLAFAVVQLLAFVATTQSLLARAPNVVVILTDDQGWGDLSVNGNTNLSTPNIDSLAADGTTLQHFYVCQVCAPTRAEFLTGRYHPRTGVSGVSRGEERLNADETTIADVFQAAGYATGAFGKWHNGTQPPLHPNNRGFDEFYGFTSGHWGHYFSPPLDHNGTRVRGKGFIVDDLTNHAIDFIKDKHDEPFFCYLPLNTPHSPMMVPDRFYEKFDGAELQMRHRDPKHEDVMMTRAALAMCENIDWNVGRVLKTIDDLNLRDETIVVYFSDNGPNSYRWNGGMKGRKGSIDEGGLRSPFFIRWPGHIPSGVKVDEIAGAIDLLPTLCDIAGIDQDTRKPIDGISLQPLLQRKRTVLPERVLFATSNKGVSVRTQQFRLDASGQLFDIGKDIGQRQDVSNQYPEIATKLRKQATRHRAEMKECFDKFAVRPFHVGYGPKTTLPARDAVTTEGIDRSAKPPNNSFFENWTDIKDAITWQINVGESGTYEAIVHYTCADGDQGAELELSFNGSTVRQTVQDVFDPPLYDKSKERVENSHYFVKDFQPLTLGRIKLSKGTGELRLGAVKKTGVGIVDVHSVELNRIPDERSASTGRAEVQDWPQPAGPNGNWQVDGHAPTHWSVVRNENVLWRTPMPEAGMSGVTVYGERVFTTTHVPIAKESDKHGVKDIIGFCLDAKTGEILWQVELPGHARISLAGGFTDGTVFAPICDGQHVYFFNRCGAIGCYDLDGKQVWLRQWTPRFKHNNRQCEPFLVDDTILYVEVANKEAGATMQKWASPTVKAKSIDIPSGVEPTEVWTYIHGIDKASGDVRWREHVGTSIHTTPVIGKTATGELAISHARGGGHGPLEKPYGHSLTSLAPGKQGTTLWSTELSKYDPSFGCHWNASYTFGFHGGNHLVMDTNSGKVIHTQPLYENATVWKRDVPAGKWIRDEKVAVKAGKGHPNTNQANLAAGDWHWFLSHNLPYLGRVHVETGKVEYLELPAQLIADAGERRRDEWLWGKGKKDNRPLNAQGFSVGDKGYDGTGWGHISAASPILIGRYLYCPVVTGTTYVIDTQVDELDGRALVAVNDLGPGGETWTLASLSYSNGRLYAHTMQEVICIGQ
tara:strand:+ start:79868 stop:83176 length:3309 start_codon:yes stop_codon:yes gene_type:complete